MEKLEYILSIIGAVYLAASIIATVTPSGKDDKIIEKIGKFFDIIGFNPRLFVKKKKK